MIMIMCSRSASRAVSTTLADHSQYPGILKDEYTATGTSMSPQLRPCLKVRVGAAIQCSLAVKCFGASNHIRRLRGEGEKSCKSVE